MLDLIFKKSNAEFYLQIFPKQVWSPSVHSMEIPVKMLPIRKLYIANDTMKRFRYSLQVPSRGNSRTFYLQSQIFSGSLTYTDFSFVFSDAVLNYRKARYGSKLPVFRRKENSISCIVWLHSRGYGTTKPISNNINNRMKAGWVAGKRARSTDE